MEALVFLVILVGLMFVFSGQKRTTPRRIEVVIPEEQSGGGIFRLMGIVACVVYIISLLQ